MISKAPGPLEYLSYIISIGNLLAGPHFHIKPYLEFMAREGVKIPSAAVALCRVTFNPLGFRV